MGWGGVGLGWVGWGGVEDEGIGEIEEGGGGWWAGCGGGELSRERIKGRGEDREADMEKGRRAGILHFQGIKNSISTLVEMMQYLLCLYGII